MTYRPSVTTHRNAHAEVRIVDERTLIKYQDGGVVAPVEEYDTREQAHTEAFRWLREMQHRWNLETTGND